MRAVTFQSEGHAAPFERGMVFSGENLVAQRLGADFNLPYFFYQLFRCHSERSEESSYGTITALIIFSIICSGVTFSASAS